MQSSADWFSTAKPNKRVQPTEFSLRHWHQEQPAGTRRTGSSSSLSIAQLSSPHLPLAIHQDLQWASWFNPSEEENNISRSRYMQVQSFSGGTWLVLEQTQNKHHHDVAVNGEELKWRISPKETCWITFSPYCEIETSRLIALKLNKNQSHLFQAIYFSPFLCAKMSVRLTIQNVSPPKKNSN